MGSLARLLFPHEIDLTYKNEKTAVGHRCLPLSVLRGPAVNSMVGPRRNKKRRRGSGSCFTCGHSKSRSRKLREASQRPVRDLRPCIRSGYRFRNRALPWSHRDRDGCRSQHHCTTGSRRWRFIYQSSVGAREHRYSRPRRQNERRRGVFLGFLARYVAGQLVVLPSVEELPPEAAKDLASVLKVSGPSLRYR